MERNPAKSHGGATGFKPPPGVTVNQIPEDKSIGSMMVSGELDAVMFYLVDPNLIDRSTVDLHNHPDIKPLFPDPLAEGVRYYKKTGIFPINHGMVIKREIAEQHPWAITNILKAFNQANDIAEPRADRARRLLFRDRAAACGRPQGGAHAAGQPRRGGESPGAGDDREILAAAGADPAADEDGRSVRAEHVAAVSCCRYSRSHHPPSRAMTAEGAERIKAAFP